MNEKLNSEKRRSKNLLAQQQYGITHDFTTQADLTSRILETDLTQYELVAIFPKHKSRLSVISVPDSVLCRKKGIYAGFAEHRAPGLQNANAHRWSAR
jgi:hypothetical protein